MLEELFEIGRLLREGLLELCEWAWLLPLALFLIAVRSLILRLMG